MGDTLKCLEDVIDEVYKLRRKVIYLESLIDGRVSDMVNELNTHKQNSDRVTQGQLKKQQDADRLKAMVDEMLVKHNNHPLIKGVDLFTVRDLYGIIVGLTDAVEEGLLEDHNYAQNTQQSKTEISKMTRMLHLAGCESVMGNIHWMEQGKRNNIRKRVFILRNVSKHMEMSKNNILKKAVELSNKAQAKYRQKLQVMKKGKSSNVDSNVSFM